MGGAAKGRFADVVDELISRGVDVDAYDGHCWTALMRATRATVTVLVRLLAYGAEVNAFSKDHKWTALGLAVDRGFHASCTSLLAGGADVNAACLDGSVPLLVALRQAEYKCVSFLLAAGANVHTVDKNGRLEVWNHVHERMRQRQCLLVAAGATGCLESFTEE